MNYKERLKQYLEEDVIYSEYWSGRCDMSDFDKFCIEHCKDIECLLNENEELNERIKVALEVLEERQSIYSNEERLKQLEETNSIECVIEILHGNY